MSKNLAHYITMWDTSGTSHTRTDKNASQLPPMFHGQNIYSTGTSGAGGGDQALGYGYSYVLIPIDALVEYTT
jgi:hypothetical protein